MLVFLMFLTYFWDFQWWKYLGLAAYDSWDPGGSFCLATGWENPSKHLVFRGKTTWRWLKWGKKIQIELANSFTKKKKKHTHPFFHKFMYLTTMMSCQAFNNKKNPPFYQISWHQETPHDWTRNSLRPSCRGRSALMHCLAETQGRERLRTCSAVTPHVAKLPEVSCI